MRPGHPRPAESRSINVPVPFSPFRLPLGVVSKWGGHFGVMRRPVAIDCLHCVEVSHAKRDRTDFKKESG